MRPVLGMREADRPILEVLSSSSLALKPGAIKYNLRTRYDQDFHQQTIYRRLRYLVHADLIEKEDEDLGYYAITEVGERLLDKELDDSEVAEITQRLQEGPPEDD